LRVEEVADLNNANDVTANPVDRGGAPHQTLLATDKFSYGYVTFSVAAASLNAQIVYGTHGCHGSSQRSSKVWLSGKLANGRGT
jgi:hypothetical protein